MKKQFIFGYKQNASEILARCKNNDEAISEEEADSNIVDMRTVDILQLPMLRHIECLIS